MKLADISVRCSGCDCYVELVGTPDDLPIENRQGTCHANPPSVVMVPVQSQPNAKDIIAGRANAGVVTTIQPATIFPVVSGANGFCANHPHWDGVESPPLH